MVLFELDDAMLDDLIGELCAGLQGDPATVRLMLRMVVKSVEMKSNEGNLQVTLPRRSFSHMPPWEFESMSPS